MARSIFVKLDVAAETIYLRFTSFACRKTYMLYLPELTSTLNALPLHSNSMPCCPASGFAVIMQLWTLETNNPTLFFLHCFVIILPTKSWLVCYTGWKRIAGKVFLSMTFTAIGW